MSEHEKPPRNQTRSSDDTQRRSGLSQGQMRYYSRSRRTRHQAEQEKDFSPQEATPDHHLICADEPKLITEQAALADLLAHVRDAGSFAYDTEFIGELTYHPKLCLIQIATTDRVALVDPLAALDLADFWETIADPAIETIVHAGVQDLEPVYRHTGRPARNIFDTQIVIGFVGLPYPLSLREAVSLLLKAKLGKGMTFTQWDQRPLSPSQLHYAAGDVRFLPALRATLADRLVESGHTQWAHAECESLSNPALYEFNARTQCRRIKGVRSLSARQMAVLAAVVEWREQRAHHDNVPPRAVVKDDALKVLARKSFKSTEELLNHGVLPRGLVRAEGDRILQAIAEARALETDQLPPVPQVIETGLQRHRIDCLWTTVQALCFGRSVHPNLVVSRQQLAELFADKIDWERIDQSPLGQGWRRELLGESIGGLLSGRRRLELTWADQTLRTEVIADSAAEQDH